MLDGLVAAFFSFFQDSNVAPIADLRTDDSR